MHGLFTEVEEGNRVHHAILGFGSGETKMTLFVTLTDLAHPEKPLYEQSTRDTSGKKVRRAGHHDPYVAAAKFVMEKNAPEKTVKKTASENSHQHRRAIEGEPNQVDRAICTNYS